MAIIKATGKSLSDYLYESFWNPMGMENSALWQIDGRKNRMEKAFCCIASNARDFAKFGKLYKDFGKWNGKVLLEFRTTKDPMMRLGKKISFNITDNKNSIPTSFEGILPDLFAENQGVIASGKYINGVFVAEEILAKHDESYLPKEVIDILKQDGLYVEPEK